MKLQDRFKASFKLVRMTWHLLSGIFLALVFVHKGIHQQPLASRLFIRWNRRLCNIFRAHITTHGQMLDEPTLFVMNHISWFDIPALATQQPLHFLSKAEVKNWPLIGWLAHRTGTLFIQRGTTGAAQKSLAEITHCLQSGGSVVVFPEGTTTDGTSVKRFHSRLLQAAIDARVKIQPVALRYPHHQGVNPYVPYIDDMSFMDSVLGLLHASTLQVELNFLTPLDQHLRTDEPFSNKQLALQAQQAIAEKLGQPTGPGNCLSR